MDGDVIDDPNGKQWIDSLSEASSTSSSSSSDSGSRSSRSSRSSSSRSRGSSSSPSSSPSRTKKRKRESNKKKKKKNKKKNKKKKKKKKKTKTKKMKRQENENEVAFTTSTLLLPKISYGKALMPGEGQLMAQFVQANQRIPRRGEIGYTSEEIQKREQEGYVMSGSRHKMMNSVRLRKEAQVQSAEGKRAMALLELEKRKQKEQEIVAKYQNLIQEKASKFTQQ